MDAYRNSDTDSKLQARADLGIEEYAIPSGYNEHTKLSADLRIISEKYRMLSNRAKEAVQFIIDADLSCSNINQRKDADE